MGPPRQRPLLQPQPPQPQQRQPQRPRQQRQRPLLPRQRPLLQRLQPPPQQRRLPLLQRQPQDRPRQQQLPRKKVLAKSSTKSVMSVSFLIDSKVLAHILGLAKRKTKRQPARCTAMARQKLINMASSVIPTSIRGLSRRTSQFLTAAGPLHLASFQLLARSIRFRKSTILL